MNDVRSGNRFVFIDACLKIEEIDFTLIIQGDACLAVFARGDPETIRKCTAESFLGAILKINGYVQNGPVGFFQQSGTSDSLLRRIYSCTEKPEMA